MPVRVDNSAPRSSVPILGDGVKIGHTTTAGVTTFDPLAVADEIWTPKFVFASADDGPITNDAVMSDDATLQLALSASATYSLEMDLFTTTDTTAHFKAGWAYTGSLTTFYWWALQAQTGMTVANSATANWGVQKTNGVSDTLDVPGTTGLAVTLCRLAGHIVTSTAGTLKFQWAQQTSTGTNTTRKAGSRLIIRRLV